MDPDHSMDPEPDDTLEHWQDLNDPGPHDQRQISIWRAFGRCSAKSKQHQRRCRRIPIMGGRVCEFHGGKAPQVKDAALRRMRELQLPAVHRVAQLIDQDTFPSTALGACNTVFDRTGMGAQSKFQHSGKVTQQLTGGDDVPKDQYEAILAEFKALIDQVNERRRTSGGS